MNQNTLTIGALALGIAAAVYGAPEKKIDEDRPPAPAIQTTAKPAVQPIVIHQPAAAKTVPDPRVGQLITAINDMATRQRDHQKSVDARLAAIRSSWRPAPVPPAEVKEVKRVSIDRTPEPVRVVTTRAVTTAATNTSTSCSGPRSAQVQSNCSGGSAPPEGGATYSAPVVTYGEPVYVQSSCSSSRSYSQPQGFIEPRFTYSAPFSNGFNLFGGT